MFKIARKPPKRKLIRRVLLFPQSFFEILSRVRERVVRNFFRRAFGDDLTAAGAAFGADVYDVVGAFDDVYVVFDENDGMAFVDEFLQYLNQFFDVFIMESDGRLIEKVDGFLNILAVEFGRNFYALTLPA